MIKNCKFLKITAMICIALLGAILLVGAELGINLLYRGLRLKNTEPPVYQKTDAVALKRLPEVKAEESVAAAAVLWVTSFYGMQKELTEEQIAEETGTAFGEVKFYNALERYMPERRREQLRYIPDGTLLERTYEAISTNRPVVATVEKDGAATYAVVTAINPEQKTVVVYFFETAEPQELTEAEFLAMLKFEGANATTKTQLFFGQITKNAILIV